MERINKYLAQLGVSSRRKIDELVSGGNITVNGQKAKLGQKIGPTDLVKINGKLLDVKPPEKVIYALNKPAGIVSTSKDELGRTSVTELINSAARLYPVGRLDKESTGLILLTNDGNLAHQLTHPKFEVQKEYIVILHDNLSELNIQKLLKGISIKGEIHKADSIIKISPKKYAITLHEGKNREIRRMIQAVKNEVIDLKRIRIGHLDLGDLKEGKYRELTTSEKKLLLA